MTPYCKGKILGSKVPWRTAAGPREANFLYALCTLKLFAVYQIWHDNPSGHPHPPGRDFGRVIPLCRVRARR